MGHSVSLWLQYKSCICEKMMSCFGLHANGSLLKVCVLKTKRRYSLSTEAPWQESSEFLVDRPVDQFTETSSYSHANS